MTESVQGEFILTNNPVVMNRCNGTIAVNGDAIDVFNRVVLYLEEGYELVTHPLAGSVRLACNPYRSLLVRSTGSKKVDRRGITAVLDSIVRVRKAMEERPVDFSLQEDYAVMDYEFVAQSAGNLCSPTREGSAERVES